MTRNIPQRVWEKMGAKEMCYHNNQQANGQTEQENPVLCCPESNNVITISCSVEKDANIETDTEME